MAGLNLGAAGILDLRHGADPVLEVRHGSALVWNSYDADARALFSRFNSEPSALRKQLVNDLIVAGKDEGWWFADDALYIMAMGLDDPGYTTADDAHAARRNWIQDAYNLTAVSSPTFASDRGHTTNGSSSYLNTNLSPASAVHYTRNSAHMGLWSRTSGLSGGVDMGARVASGSDQTTMLIRGNVGSGNFRVAVNCDATPADVATSADGSGHFVAVRPDSVSNIAYRDGAAEGSPLSTASEPPPAFAIFIGALNQSGTAIGHIARQYAAAHIGGSLSPTQVAAKHATLLTYMQAVEAA